MGIAEDDLVLAYIGRHWIKGGHVVEQALAALPPLGRRIVLLRIGDPAADRRSLGPNCEVWSLGLVSRDDLPRVFGVADVGVMPSLCEEGFGLAAIEMMACGLPIIASRAGGLPEVVEDGGTGVLVDLPNAVDGWTEAIAGLLGDQKARVRIGDRARAVACERFSPQAVLRAWDRVFTHLARA